MKNVTLAIRGGGVKTPAIGVLKAFEENCIEVHAVSGTSMGAVIATLVAIDTPADEIYHLFKRYVVDYSDASRTRGGKGSQVIEDTVNEQCGFLKFKDVKKTLYIAANQGGLWNTKPFLFSKKTTPEITVGEACRASCSFPFLYERYSINISGKKIKFFDGGMTINPYIPTNESLDTVSVLATFKKNKEDLKRIEKFFIVGGNYFIFSIILAVIVIFNHRENVKRILEGKENKLSFKKTN